jgi:alginate O-acetyltransferase complex protein AlgI
VLFNSHPFLLVFLPVAFAGHVVASKLPPFVSVAWLILCSLVFYGFWSPAFLSLLLLSVLFNFTAGRLIGASHGALQRWLFIGAVAANLLLLGFFKYLDPLLDFGSRYGLLPDWSLNIILPLGISFFTFTQIGWLVDRRDGIADDLDPARYLLFVTFFPHIVAGPILHVREIGPQLLDPRCFQPRASGIAPALTLFVLGLAKKLLLADPLAATVAAGYSHPELLSMAEGWTTALAYSLQLYFDFSGYSDMAIGLAGLFGFRFPTNFNSPYKARSIIDYWQRWHMTLSRYLALLIFNPIALAITRRRVARGLKVSHKAVKTPAAFLSMLALPTVVTMGLAGIWHGAGLQFAVFGLLHALYLVVNHAARMFGRPMASKNTEIRAIDIVWKVGLTYFSVLVASVFFRASSCGTALDLLSAMTGFHGSGLPARHILTLHSFAQIAVSFCIVWGLPNSQQILGRFAPTLEPPAPLDGFWHFIRWRPNPGWAVIGGVALWATFMKVNQSTIFLYFQF